MNFVEFHTKVMKIIRNQNIPRHDNENHKIHRITLQKYENHESLCIPCQNHENNEIHRIPRQNT